MIFKILILQYWFLSLIIFIQNNIICIFIIFLLQLIQFLIKYISIIIVLMLIYSYIFFKFCKEHNILLFFINNIKYPKLNNYNSCNKNHKYSNMKELKIFKFFQKLQLIIHKYNKKIWIHYNNIMTKTI